MKWFKPKHRVCCECKVHFEPVTGYEERWGNYCSVHRAAIMIKDQKSDRVVLWAREHVDEVAALMKKEVAQAGAQNNAALNAAFNTSSGFNVAGMGLHDYGNYRMAETDPYDYSIFGNEMK